MPTAHELITPEVAEGAEEDRLTDVSRQIQAHGIHYCIVLEPATRRFIGLIRLGEIAARSNASHRILADLISDVKPVFVAPDEPLDHVAALFTQNKIGEAVVLNRQGIYVGLITASSVLAWSERERQRTAEILRATLVRLEDASIARKNLIEGLSHELRTPLTPVLLMASHAAVDPSLPKELRRNFEEIAELIGHEAKLIDDLLDQKAIERGTLALEKKPVSIDAVLRDVVACAKAAIVGKAIDFAYELTGGEPVVSGDSARLQQAMSHLLDNALKFTPPGGKLRLVAQVQPDAQTVTITLSDTGIGFTPDQSERAFVAMSRDRGSDPMKAQEFPGLGLGLSIARAIIELHGGSIEVTSDGRDRGTTVTVIFLMEVKASKTAS